MHTWCFVSVFLVVGTSAINCLERLVSEMTCYVSSGTLNSTQNNQTQHYIHQKHKRETEKKLPKLTKQSTPLFRMPFITSGQETEWALFVWPQSPHGAHYRKIKI